MAGEPAAALSRDETKQGATTGRAERDRFAVRASAFLLVNRCAERCANAPVRHLDARLRSVHSVADLHAITIDRAALELRWRLLAAFMGPLPVEQYY